MSTTKLDGVVLITVEIIEDETLWITETVPYLLLYKQFLNLECRKWNYLYIAKFSLPTRKLWYVIASSFTYIV